MSLTPSVDALFKSRTKPAATADAFTDGEPRIEMSDGQHALYDAVIGRFNVLATGPGGTGKTATLKMAVQDLRASKVGVAVTASTGVAAINIGGVTIHSLLGVGIAKNNREMVCNISEKGLFAAADRLDKIRTIVVDEASMLTGDWVDMMHTWLCKVRAVIEKGRYTEPRPFGGWQVVFLADFLQLPPVVPESFDKVVALYAFESRIWSHAGIRSFYLRRGYRQSDPEFRKHLLRIRKGWAPKDTLDYINARYDVPMPADIKPTRVVSTHEEARRINAEEFNSLSTPIKVYPAEYEGQDKYWLELERDMPAYPNMHLRVGTDVLFIKNNLAAGYANGTRGRVISIDKDVIVETANGTVTVVPAKWEKKSANGDVVATVAQLPLIYAWAVTIHRVQGLTLDYMEFDPSRIFDRAMAYVALSRVRTIDGLWMRRPLTDEAVRASKKCVQFYEKLLKEESAG